MMKYQLNNNKKWIFILIIFITIIIVELLLLKVPNDQERKQEIVEDSIYNDLDSVQIIDKLLSDTDSSGPIDTLEKKDINNYIFVGDSRFVAMKEFAQEDDLFICQDGVGIEFFKNNLQNILNKAYEDDVIIIGLGINDINADILYSYYQLLCELEGLTDAEVYYMTINPVDEEMEALNGYTIKNSSIDEYNSEIKEKLKCINISIIDTNYFLTKNGFVSYDGIHYDKDTYKELYEFVKHYVEYY